MNTGLALLQGFARVRVMIHAKPLPQTSILELRVAAPFSAEDFERVGAALGPFREQGRRVKLLVLAESIGLPGPQALWEDLKLAQYIGTISRVAVLTDVAWYGKLAELESALLPRTTIKRFGPDEREGALEWLQAPADALPGQSWGE